MADEARHVRLWVRVKLSDDQFEAYSRDELLTDVPAIGDTMDLPGVRFPATVRSRHWDHQRMAHVGFDVFSAGRQSLDEVHVDDPGAFARQLLDAGFTPNL